MNHPIAASIFGGFCIVFGVALALLGGYEAVAKISASNGLASKPQSNLGTSTKRMGVAATQLGGSLRNP